MKPCNSGPYAGPSSAGAFDAGAAPALTASAANASRPSMATQADRETATRDERMVIRWAEKDKGKDRSKESTSPP
ncbi:hypothetical protein PPGU16_20120 [Paraburkholderia largidicola]|uniref:Uncharacterized protein n=1 Tax=Paraburkholderia largidicola TaxID=3014751 RepID=A0A7I8BKC8_9BURK|nr:hypothetical protein PPGU16_20120 [Paraburkholderia sp. PGU16]